MLKLVYPCASVQASNENYRVMLHFQSFKQTNHCAVRMHGLFN